MERSTGPVFCRTIYQAKRRFRRDRTMPPPSAISPARPHIVHSPTVGTVAATALTVWLTAADPLFGQLLSVVYAAVTLRVPGVGKTRLAVTEELPTVTVVSVAAPPNGVPLSKN